MGENIISVTSERVVYDGQLGKLQQHSHALDTLSSPWPAAIATWSQHRDCRPLLACAAEAFRTSPAALDRRVLELAAHFNRGELLDAEMPEMAARIGLSPSRLVHLIKSELGVGVRRLKQHYRFKVVARAAAEGQNLTTAAHAAGFADSGHFSRTFLQTFGMSPSKVLLRRIGTDYLT